MLTPHVVGNPEEGAQRTEEFRQRLDWLEEMLRQSQSREEKPWWLKR